MQPLLGERTALSEADWQALKDKLAPYAAWLAARPDAAAEGDGVRKLEQLAHYVRDLLQEHQMPAERVCFEITETAAIANLNTALKFIHGVKALGCRVALDDFGAGLSSFSYLKTLPADFLKIDGAFIRDMMDDPMDAAIVEAINTIGHVAGLKTIAEFVENDTVRARLVEIGVDYAQGYGIHRPEPFGAP